MANRNNKKKMDSEGGKAMYAEGWLSIAAFVLSIISIVMSFYYSDKEYKYKLSPDIEALGNMEAETSLRDDGLVEIDIHNKDAKIRVLHKNNLQAAFLIHADNTVEKMKVDEIEGVIESELKNELDLDDPDFTINEINYSYEFLFVLGKDDTYELFLIYVKDGKLGGSYNGESSVAFDTVSGIELLEFEKAHPNDDNYEGEKELAKRYMEVLETCRKYIP